jgi:hypothetical protein
LSRTGVTTNDHFAPSTVQCVHLGGVHLGGVELLGRDAALAYARGQVRKGRELTVRFSAAYEAASLNEVAAGGVANQALAEAAFDLREGAWKECDQDFSRGWRWPGVSGENPWCSMYR